MTRIDELDPNEFDADAIARDLINDLRAHYDREDNPIAHQLGLWIADHALNGTCSVIDYIDSGYDYSSYGRRTNEPYKVEDFETVEEFLEEPSGNTNATFISGSGFAAEELSEEFEREVLDALTTWVSQQHRKKYGLEVADFDLPGWQEFWDLVCDERLDGVYWHEVFAPKRLADVVNKHRAEAEELQRQREIERAEQERIARAKAEIAERVHRRFMLLVGRRKARFTIPGKPKILRLLRRIEANLGPNGGKDVAIYIRYLAFKTFASNRLRSELQAEFPE